MDQQRLFKLGLFTLFCVVCIWFAVNAMNEAKEMAQDLERKSEAQNRKIELIQQAIGVPSDASTGSTEVHP